MSIFSRQMEVFSFISPSITFSMGGENFYKQLTVCCGGCSLSVFSGIML